MKYIIGYRIFDNPIPTQFLEVFLRDTVPSDEEYLALRTLADRHLKALTANGRWYDAESRWSVAEVVRYHPSRGPERVRFPVASARISSFLERRASMPALPLYWPAMLMLSVTLAACATPTAPRKKTPPPPDTTQGRVPRDTFHLGNHP